MCWEVLTEEGIHVPVKSHDRLKTISSNSNGEIHGVEDATIVSGQTKTAAPLEIEREKGKSYRVLRMGSDRK